MKTHDIGAHGGPHRPENLENKGNRADKPSSPRIETGDRLEISDVARRRLHLFEAAKDLPDVRADTVSGLREAVDKGTYSVDSRRLAQAVLELEDELFR